MAKRLRRLPSLFVADVGVAHRGADILVAETDWDVSLWFALLSPLLGILLGILGGFLLYH
jgi:hypothetical protein